MAESEATLPAEAKSITTELLEDVLKKVEKCEHGLVINNFNVAKADPTGKNFICVVFRVNVKFTIANQQKERDLIFKVVPDSVMSTKFAIEENKVVQKERDVYTMLIPGLEEYRRRHSGIESRISAPRFYHCKVEGATGIVVLEDLCHHGYKMADIRTGFDYDHCKLAMEELGKFHALSFAIKDGNVDNITNKFGDIGRESNFTPYVRGVFYPVFYEGVKASFELVKTSMKDDKISASLDNFLETKDLFDVMLLAPKEPYSVLCHGDFWGNNMMFQYETDGDIEKPVSIKLLDFQFVRYARPTSDLVWFFYTSTTRELRQNHLKELLDIYYVTFCETMRDLKKDLRGFSRDVLWDLYRLSVPGGVVFASFVLGSILCDSDDSVDLTESNSKEEYSKLATEMSAKMQKIAEKNTNVVGRLRGLILDALEMNLL